MNTKQLWCCEHRSQGNQWNAKRASTRKYLRGWGNLCSSADYNEGQLTLMFNTISCSLQPRAANNQINTVGCPSSLGSSCVIEIQRHATRIGLERIC